MTKMLFSIMKKIPTLLALILIIMTQVMAQTEKPISKTVSANLEKYYNAGNYQAIFDLFSAAMKGALPVDKANAFFGGLKAQSGNITKRDFVKYEGGYALYKTKFEHGLWAVKIAVDENDKISGLYVAPFIDESLPKIERNTTKLTLPFNSEWNVVWGGDTKELNYHVESRAQKNAFDILIKNASGRTYKTNGKTNEDYYAFGQQLFAPCAGEVVLVTDGVNDNVPGVMNPAQVTGNTVIIKTANGEFLLFAHFKQNSIVVKQGQQVKQGDPLGLCGNSGNSSEPHLHFHIQNGEEMMGATGVKCYFDQIVVNGQLKTDYSPIQGERIRNK